MIAHFSVIKIFWNNKELAYARYIMLNKKQRHQIYIPYYLNPVKNICTSEKVWKKSRECYQASVCVLDYEFPPATVC